MTTMANNKKVVIRPVARVQAPKDLGIADTAGNKLTVFDDDADDDVVLAVAFAKDGAVDEDDMAGFGLDADQAVALGRKLIASGAKAGAALTYAEAWSEAIEESYDGQEAANFLQDDDLLDGEDFDEAEKRILTKAAECLRSGVPATFTAPELELVRHLMPAHVVHQSFASRWMLDNYEVEIALGSKGTS